MRYLLPPALNTVRPPTKETGAKVPLDSPGLRHFADSMESAQCHISALERGARSMNSLIRFSVTILNASGSHGGNLMVN